MIVLRSLWSLFLVAMILVGVIFGKIAASPISDWATRFSPNGAELPQYFELGIIGLGGLLGSLFALLSFRKMIYWVTRFEEVSLLDKVAAVIGVVLGLVVALLITLPFAQKPQWGVPVSMLVSVTGVVLGVAFSMSAKEQISYMFPSLISSGHPRSTPANAKMLDTNIIIDGRIADIAAAGFLEGPIYIPDFILQELRHIADSADSLKRARGRRGLDILVKLKNIDTVHVSVYEDYTEEEIAYEEVDARLVKLAKARRASVVTNDFSVNEICKLNGVPALNVNELASAVKPVFLPGEELTVTIVKEGKEVGQGIGYLDDGTMVVVEGASNQIGQLLAVLVTSVLQTTAGKMIFAEPKRDEGAPAPAYASSNRGGRSRGGNH
jgi:uncharacterized protein YacL